MRPGKILHRFRLGWLRPRLAGPMGPILGHAGSEIHTRAWKRTPKKGRSAQHPSISWFERARPERRLVRGRAYRRAKRLVDLSLIVLGLPLILTVLALCWCAIKLESPLRPALFVQPRTGLRGKRFPMLKFRTMVPDAEEIKGDLLAYSKLRWPDFKMDNDPRVTRVGRILRTTSLDELPQIFNVVKGDMSLVGPRPTSFAADTYEPWQRPRLRVLPGLTGLWQISGRASLEFDERVRLDLAYIKVRSLSVDFQILARTFGAVLFRRGAS